jgi:hypothetical protein
MTDSVSAAKIKSIIKWATSDLVDGSHHELADAVADLAADHLRRVDRRFAGMSSHELDVLLLADIRNDVAHELQSFIIGVGRDIRYQAESEVDELLERGATP